MVKTQWERELAMFIGVSLMVLLVSPKKSCKHQAHALHLAHTHSDTGLVKSATWQGDNEQRHAPHSCMKRACAVSLSSLKVVHAEYM